ncbi:MAG: hypothetical protein WCJ62_07270 [Flavobacterium sp.]
MKKKIKIIVGSAFGVMLLLFGVLVFHIATAKPVVYDNATMQISRIDFQEQLDSVKMKTIHRQLKSMPGFINDSYNLETGVLVYFHDNRIADSKKIFEELMSKGNYKATRYIVPKELASNKVCPVMNEGSISYAFTKQVKRIFN